MSVLKTLRERVARELNHLYTTPPAETPAGIDCGWHGREHALHTYFVARMFGGTAELCVGDFAVLSRFLPPLTTMEREMDHAWCTVNGVAPVDLSMTFALFANAPQLRNAVVGEGRNGDWEIQYAEDDSAIDDSFSNRNEILFVENEIVELPDLELLRNPLVFLSKSASSSPQSWQSRLDPEIYAKITLHCFNVAHGRAANVRHRLSRDDAVAWIATNYTEAEGEILTILRQTHPQPQDAAKRADGGAA
jgi:hypothetical protein